MHRARYFSNNYCWLLYLSHRYGFDISKIIHLAFRFLLLKTDPWVQTRNAVFPFTKKNVFEAWRSLFARSALIQSEPHGTESVFEMSFPGIAEQLLVDKKTLSFLHDGCFQYWIKKRWFFCQLLICYNFGNVDSCFIVVKQSQQLQISWPT